MCLTLLDSPKSFFIVGDRPLGSRPDPLAISEKPED
jgi:hypothetical protein